jgi:hypothetical protein
MDKINHDDLFQLTTDERVEVIKQSVDILLDQIILSSRVQNKPFQRTFNETMFALSNMRFQAQEEEDYEMCYYLNELEFGLTNKIDQLKKK